MLPKINTRTKAAYIAAIITALAGIIVLVGWQLGNYQLKTFGFGGVTMKVNTALSFLFAGLSLVFLQQKDQKIKLYLARIFSFGALLLGTLVLSQYLFNINLGIDELLFSEVENAVKTVNLGRMAPNTSLNFILVGLSLLLISFSKTKNSLFAVFLITLVLCISIFGIIGYVFGLTELTGLAVYTKMALNTSLVFIVISIGMLFTMYNDSKIIVSMERKLFAGITVASVVVLFVSTNSITSIKSLVSVSNKVQHTEVVKAELNKINANIYEMVANLRGLLISNNEEFIADWNESKATVLISAKNLEALTKDNPTQQKNLNTLNQLLKERIDYSELLIQTKKTEGPETTNAIFSTLKGKQISNKINDVILKMIEEENRLLTLRNESEANNADQSLTIIVLSLFVQLILLGLIFLFVTKDLSGRKKAQQELLNLNENLEEIVEERTTELKYSHEKIIIERDKASQYLDIAGVMLVLLDSTGKVAKVNKKGCEVLGYTENEIVGKDWFSTVIPENIKDDVRGAFKAMMNGEIEVLEFYENPIIHKNGEERLIEWHNVLIFDKDGNITGTLSSGEDITERKIAERELQKANRVYAVLSNINQTIVRLTDKQTLFEEVCRIAVDEGKFQMAFIGMVDERINKFLPVATAGNAAEYVKTIDIDLNDAVLGAGPIGKCIKTGVHKLANDIANNPEMNPWRENALQLGNKSSAAFPIKLFGKTIGAFLIYSNELNFFDENEVKLLDELAMDISFALEFIENEDKRKQIEEEIHASEERLSIFIENINVGVVVHDLQSKITFANSIAEEFLGLLNEDLIGRNADDPIWFFIDENGKRLLTSEYPANKVLSSKEPIRDLIIGLTTVSRDKTTWILVNGVPQFNTKNELIEVIMSFVDITERKLAEEEIHNINATLENKVEERTKQLEETNIELQNAKTEAERANVAKSEFLSRMSHELRTPLNSILGFTQLMSMGELNPTHKKGVDHIMKSGKHLLNLINEVLDLSRIEAGELSISIEPVEIIGVISETLDIINPLAEENNIKLELVNVDTQQLFAKADHQKLKQVLLNLINNAVKYNSKGGLVTIKAVTTQNEKVRISITDTGKGIAAEELQKLFMPFQRIGKEISAVEGTGLGLAVSKKLIEAMNGTISVKSDIDKGSTFWIELPQCEGQLKGSELDVIFEAMGNHNANNAGTVLYIEDNISNQQLVKQIIDTQRPAINLITNLYGKDTVKLALDYKPNVILLDLDLPDIHGSEVLELLQKDSQTKEIPVIILSADAMDKQIEKLLNLGAKTYLTKPLDVLEFLKEVDKWM